MEFITFEEAIDALADVGVSPVFADEQHLRLEADEEALPEEACFMHLADPACTAKPDRRARRIEVPKAALPEAVESMIGALHLAQVLVFPVGKWRSVFDAVAFSLASNEDWQAVDAMATVELNTRDALLCDPGDYHTLRALIGALLSDAESPNQGITIASAAMPFIAEVVPEGCVRITVGNQVLADEIAEVLHI